jgi:D-alanyl-lipoteichoic acid acyltransferase DltB (MBOAT superfamily)
LSLLPLLISFVLFVALMLAAGRLLALKQRPVALALLNLAALYPLCVLAGSAGVRLHEVPHYLAAIALVYVFYVLIVLIQYWLLRSLGTGPGDSPWVPILFPIVALIAIKLTPAHWVPLLRDSSAAAGQRLPGFLLGISYMAFRLSSLALEVRARAVRCPGLSEYLGFAFFVPTLAVGPINSYSNYSGNPQRRPIEASRALLRMLVGFTKYIFVANLFNQLSYAGLIFDGHPHLVIDLLVAMIATYLFLYLNFSGYTDMVIGAAGLLGVPVTENFNNPFAARNVRDFWNRWHITLSVFVRDLVFTPLSKSLIRLFGPSSASHAVALAIVPVFIIIGLWHGLAWNFFVFGVLHALGVVVNHYYTNALKRRLGSKGIARYNANPLIRAVAVCITFAYVAITILFFSNSIADLRSLATVIR